ncbi:hypothetical protein CXG81DRAFT_24798 [Caulochytrium protostelioides]|uniref:Chitin synthase 4-like domain-containing protein n=1 Tax=Caulochytrium protostelioides TaxID=1555241 RepID=A0A4P9XB14_9FUNG|nr:hypothetical protein CXG81DRAFT_24798 [Caulochytrium protostelioides]|eukprot:RKP02583.1 hypothetical protein CXG81DRAFT_24798 [Caulochytrium protostelioides]
MPSRHGAAPDGRPVRSAATPLDEANYPSDAAAAAAAAGDFAVSPIAPVPALARDGETDGGEPPPSDTTIGMSYDTLRAMPQSAVVAGRPLSQDAQVHVAAAAVAWPPVGPAAGAGAGGAGHTPGPRVRGRPREAAEDAADYDTEPASDRSDWVAATRDDTASDSDTGSFAEAPLSALHHPQLSRSHPSLDGSSLIDLTRTDPEVSRGLPSRGGLRPTEADASFLGRPPAGSRGSASSSSLTASLRPGGGPNAAPLPDFQPLSLHWDGPSGAPSRLRHDRSARGQDPREDPSVIAQLREQMAQKRTSMSLMSSFTREVPDSGITTPTAGESLMPDPITRPPGVVTSGLKTAAFAKPGDTAFMLPMSSDAVAPPNPFGEGGGEGGGVAYIVRATREPQRGRLRSRLISQLEGFTTGAPAARTLATHTYVRRLRWLTAMVPSDHLLKRMGVRGPIQRLRLREHVFLAGTMILITLVGTMATWGFVQLTCTPIQTLAWGDRDHQSAFFVHGRVIPLTDPDHFRADLSISGRDGLVRAVPSGARLFEANVMGRVANFLQRYEITGHELVGDDLSAMTSDASAEAVCATALGPYWQPPPCTQTLRDGTLMTGCFPQEILIDGAHPHRYPELVMAWDDVVASQRHLVVFNSHVLDVTRLLTVPSPMWTTRFLQTLSARRGEDVTMAVARGGLHGEARCAEALFRVARIGRRRMACAVSHLLQLSLVAVVSAIVVVRWALQFRAVRAQAHSRRSGNVPRRPTQPRLTRPPPPAPPAPTAAGQANDSTEYNTWYGRQGHPSGLVSTSASSTPHPTASTSASGGRGSRGPTTDFVSMPGVVVPDLIIPSGIASSGRGSPDTGAGPGGGDGVDKGGGYGGYGGKKSGMDASLLSTASVQRTDLPTLVVLRGALAKTSDTVRLRGLLRAIADDYTHAPQHQLVVVFLESDATSVVPETDAQVRAQVESLIVLDAQWAIPPRSMRLAQHEGHASRGLAQVWPGAFSASPSLSSLEPSYSSDFTGDPSKPSRKPPPLLPGHGAIPAVIVTLRRQIERVSLVKSQPRHHPLAFMTHFLHKAVFDKPLSGLEYDLFIKIQMAGGIAPTRYEALVSVGLAQDRVPALNFDRGAFSKLLDCLQQHPDVTACTGDHRISEYVDRAHMSASDRWLDLQGYAHHRSHFLPRNWYSSLQATHQLSLQLSAFRLQGFTPRGERVPHLLHPSVTEAVVWPAPQYAVFATLQNDLVEALLRTLPTKRLRLVAESRFWSQVPTSFRALLDKACTNYLGQLTALTRVMVLSGLRGFGPISAGMLWFIDWLELLCGPVLVLWLLYMVGETLLQLQRGRLRLAWLSLVAPTFVVLLLVTPLCYMLLSQKRGTRWYAMSALYPLMAPLWLFVVPLWSVLYYPYYAQRLAGDDGRLDLAPALQAHSLAEAEVEIAPLTFKRLSDWVKHQPPPPPPPSGTAGLSTGGYASGRGVGNSRHGGGGILSGLSGGWAATPLLPDGLDDDDDESRAIFKSNRLRSPSAESVLETWVAVEGNDPLDEGGEAALLAREGPEGPMSAPAAAAAAATVRLPAAAMTLPMPEALGFDVSMPAALMAGAAMPKTAAAGLSPPTVPEGATATATATGMGMGMGVTATTFNLSTVPHATRSPASLTRVMLS